MTLSRQIAEFTRDVTLDDIPDAVRDRARLHLLDALGIAIASSGMDFGESVHRAGLRLGAGDEATVLGFGSRLPAPSAALVNGTLIHGLDFDDTHIEAIHHATAPALAAALAAAEQRRADGENTLLAYILGLEIGCRLAAAGSGAFHDRGFHPTGILGTFAAACVTGSLRRLDPATIVDALGLCGSQAAGLLEIKRSWLKRFHPGWAAHGGIIATTLAEEGFRGPATIFEGDLGLYASHLGTGPDLDLGDLGGRWMAADIALKPYPCCHFIHAFVDAALQLRADGVVLDDIVSIECPTTDRLQPVISAPPEHRVEPPTIYDALFSVQYAVALALVRGRVDVAAFHDEPLDDPAVLRISRLVRCPADPNSDYPRHFPGEVVITIADGRIVRNRVPASRGTPDWPLSAEEVAAKFHANAERTLPPEQARRVAEAAARIDSLGSVTDLVAACATTAKGTGAARRASTVS